MTGTNTSAKRNISIDYLRGLAATGILCYHMYLFNFGEADSSSILAKIKIYGVAIFYVISGLTLSIVYLNKLQFNKASISDFYFKRAVRVIPLLWLATILQVLIDSNHGWPPLKKIATNVTVFYGSFKPSTFLVGGAWSIGNEILFYLFFPLLVWLIVKNIKWFYLALLIIAAPFFYNTFKGLNPAVTLGHQWDTYANSFNQFIYFAIGILFGTFQPALVKFKNYLPVFIIILVLLFTYYPVTGEPIQLVVGLTRIALSLLTIAVCYLFYNCNFEFLPGFIKAILKFLAECSYSIYLLHQIIYAGLQRFVHGTPVVMISLTVSLTLILSYISYNYFELFFMNWGKRYVQKKRTDKLVASAF
jgi:exopolysaccharide production protein ExoZ